MSAETQDYAAFRASLGLPPPRLIFPFAETRADGTRLFHTDEPSAATAGTRFEAAALGAIGTPALPAHGPGHRAQADTLLTRADCLVAVVDEGRAALPGGTVDTVRRARAAGKTVIVVPPAP